MTSRKRHLGDIIRDYRESKRITLRRFAERVGVSPTYISQVEQGNTPAPTAERLRVMAQILEIEPDELLAAGGRMADDVAELIEKRPVELATFLRAANGLTADQLRKLTEQARKLKEKGN